MALNERDLQQVRDYVIRVLPGLLREEPEIAATIEGILAQQFPRRDEFARLLDELALLREDTERRFALQIEETQQFREGTEKRFNLLHDQMDKRFALLWEDMERRFEQSDRTLVDVRRGVAKLEHGHEMLLNRMEGQGAWLRFVTGTLQAEKGKTLEDMFAAALRYGLQDPDIAPEKIRLRQRLVDTEGQVFKPGFATEVDLITENSKLTVFEVKATAKPSDVDFFALKVQLVEARNPDKEVQGTFIALAAGPDVRHRCADYGLALVD